MEVCLPTDDETAQGRSNWKGVLKSYVFLDEHVQFKLNNGKSIRFWLDNWTQNGTLKSRFPAIYKACGIKKASIFDMIVESRLQCQTRRNLYLNEQLEWDMLCNQLGPFHGLNEEEDEVDIMGGFNVKKCYETLLQDGTNYDFNKFLWKKGIPPRGSFMIWAHFHNSLPTVTMLNHRGVHIQSVQCLFCNSEEETTNHIFVGFSFAFEVWSYFIKAFKVSWVAARTVATNFEAWRVSPLHGKSRKVRDKLIYAVLWHLWTERNNRNFGGRAMVAEEVIMLIKQTLVLWFYGSEVFKDYTVN
ncbi:uncharacterized protein LOC113296196 [Papaver somniferum]|uniref:uncharacterized protein LOC113296196 n=1 Tax=Papaver somniferum TaxID=3469 RepID=UPI000E704D52|nr:uncharacterized protein LOC113296196 [Papaver somniferum]